MTKKELMKKLDDRNALMTVWAWLWRFWVVYAGFILALGITAVVLGLLFDL